MVLKFMLLQGGLMYCKASLAQSLLVICDHLLILVKAR